MSIGYSNMTSYDFNNYFRGCYAFFYNAESTKVETYSIQGVGDDSGGNRQVSSSRISLRPMPRGRSLQVTARELFESPQWILHRFPVEYITPDGKSLYRLHVEPSDRRMRKGTSLDYLGFQGILNAPIDQADTAINDHMVNGRYGNLPNTAQTMKAIASILTLGMVPYMRRNMSAEQATTNCKRAVHKMLVSKAIEVAVPSPNIALVRYSEDRSKAMVINSGVYIGYVSLEDNHLRFTGQELAYNDSTAGDIAKRGLEDIALRVFADEVVWSEA